MQTHKPGRTGSHKDGSQTTARDGRLISGPDNEPAGDTHPGSREQVTGTRTEDEGNGVKRTKACPFCNPLPRHIVLSNDLCYARWDINPVSRGHLLIIPYRHVPDFFDTTPDERYAIMDLGTGSKSFLQEKFHPSGYNFGVNAGEAAGQVIGHVHVHLIPRYRGDAGTKPNGMRNVIPKRPVPQHKLSEY